MTVDRVIVRTSNSLSGEIKERDVAGRDEDNYPWHFTAAEIVGAILPDVLNAAECHAKLTIEFRWVS